MIVSSLSSFVNYFLKFERLNTMFPAPIKGYKFGIFDSIMDCYYLVADLLRHRAEIFMKNKFGSGIRVLSKFKFGSNQVRFHTIRKSPNT